MNLKQEQGAERAWRQVPLHVKSVRAVLTVEECEAIKNDAMALGLRRAEVVRRVGKATKPSPRRTNDFVKLPRSPDREWLIERLMAKSEDLNQRLWRFAITGMDGVEVLRYKPMQFFKWHFDTYPGSARKITCIINLSSPRSYWRGGLQVRGLHPDHAIAPLQGAGTWFPTYLHHRATAPWWGERWVLVAWLTGPDWI